MQDLARVASALLAGRRKRAVTAEQQRRLTAFALVAGDWLWETDVQHRLVWISSAYANQPPLTELWQLGQAMDDAAVLESPDFPANAPQRCTACWTRAAALRVRWCGPMPETYRVTCLTLQFLGSTAAVTGRVIAASPET